MFRVAVLTISDSSASGKREDLSGPLIVELVERAGYSVLVTEIIPDEQTEIEGQLKELADGGKVELILTTGGTGFSNRDVTPEATINVCERLVPGIPEAMRALSLSVTPNAMLTRAAAGIRGSALIINMPGSPKAVRECLEYILPPLEHGLEILTGRASNCGETAKKPL